MHDPLEDRFYTGKDIAEILKCSERILYAKKKENGLNFNVRLYTKAQAQLIIETLMNSLGQGGRELPPPT